jgi:hypothetical protein
MFCEKCHAGSLYIMFPVASNAGDGFRICPQCRLVSDKHLNSSPFPPPGSSSLHKRGNMKKQQVKQTEESFHEDIAVITGGSVKAVDLSKIAPSID